MNGNDPKINEMIIDILHSLGWNDLIFFDHDGNITTGSSFNRIFVNDLNIIIQIDNDSIRLILPNTVSLESVQDLMKKLNSIPGISTETIHVNDQITPRNLQSGDQIMNSIRLNEAKISINDVISLLKDIYSYTGSGSTGSKNLQSVKDSEWIRQAKRLMAGIKLKSPDSIRSDDPGSYSPDPEIRRYQILYRYYATLSELFNPVEDTILANTASRVADHFMAKLMNTKTLMSDHDPLFKKTIKLLNLIGKRNGFSLEDFVRKEMKKPVGLVNEDQGEGFVGLKKKLMNWFERFKCENIFT